MTTTRAEFEEAVKAELKRKRMQSNREEIETLPMPTREGVNVDRRDRVPRDVNGEPLSLGMHRSYERGTEEHPLAHASLEDKRAYLAKNSPFTVNDVKGFSRNQVDMLLDIGEPETLPMPKRPKAATS